MPISTELTRMAQNVGALTADTNAIFEALRAKGVDVPANAQLSDVADMIESIVPSHQNEVEIGGRWYPYVQIGNQLWTTENLDWKLDGIAIGASGNPTTPSAWYYNNDEATYGVNGNKYGLLYNWYSIDILTQSLSDGWRVPTSDDFNTLGEYASGLSNAGTKLKSTSGWEPLPNFPNPNGTDDYGFSGLPSGLRVNGSFNYATNYSFYLTTTESSDEVFYRAGLSVNTDLAIQPLNKNTGNSIRLVKDAPGYVTIGGRQYKTVTIGNQEWLAENLDWKFNVNGNQIPIGQSGNPLTPAAWYYDNNETDYGIDGTYKLGLMYNWYAVKYLDDNKATLLPDGWHVPTLTEFNALVTTVGGSSVAGTKLKALDNSIVSGFPSDWNGNDYYGFKLLPSGIYYTSTFWGVGTRTNMWSIIEGTYNPRTNAFNVMINNTLEEIRFNENDKNTGFSLRLVKDLT